MTTGDRYPGWEETLSRLQPVAKRLAEKLRDPEDEQARQELYKMMMSAVVGGYVGLVYNDPDYPEWVPMLSNALNFAARSRCSTTHWEKDGCRLTGKVFPGPLILGRCAGWMWLIFRIS